MITDFDGLSLGEASALAQHLENAAGILRRHAASIDERQQREARARAHVEHVSASGRAVLDKLAAGYNSIESAVDAVARDMELPVFVVLANYRREALSRKRDATAYRQRVVVELVKFGLKNDEIAARLGVHSNTVSRAISAHLFPELRPVDRARFRKRRRLK